MNLLLTLSLNEAVSAGGDDSCDTPYELTIPVFNQFNVNVTATLDDCLTRIDDFNVAYSLSLSHDDLVQGLRDINIDCHNQFNGYLLDFVSELVILLGASSSDMFDIIHNGPRSQMNYPLICIANELTSAFPNIMIATGEITTAIYEIIFA